MRLADPSVFKKPRYRKISFCRKGGSFLKAVFAFLLSANARLSIGCIGTIRGSGSNSIFTRAKSPTSIPAPRRIGVLRYSLHAPWYFTIVCLNLFPFNVPLTGRGPFVLPAFLNNACKTFQECWRTDWRRAWGFSKKMISSVGRFKQECVNFERKVSFQPSQLQYFLSFAADRWVHLYVADIIELEFQLVERQPGKTRFCVQVYCRNFFLDFFLADVKILEYFLFAVWLSNLRFRMGRIRKVAKVLVVLSVFLPWDKLFFRFL